MNLRKFISGVSALAIAASAFAAMAVTASADANTQVWDVSQYTGEAHVSLEVNDFYYGSDNTYVESADDKVEGTDYLKIHTGSGDARGVIVNGTELGGSQNYIKLGVVSNKDYGYISFTPAYTGTVTITGAYFNSVANDKNGITNYATANSNKTITGNCVAGTEVKILTAKNFIVQSVTVTEAAAEYVGTSWNFAGNANETNLSAGTFYKLATDGARFTEKTGEEWETGVLYVKPTSDSTRSGQIGIVETGYSSALKVRGDFEIDYTPENASYVTIECNYNNSTKITDYVKVTAGPSSTLTGKTLTYYVPAGKRLQVIGTDSSKAVSIKSITVTPASGSLTQQGSQFDSDVAGDNVKAKAGTYTVPASANTVSVGIGSKIQSKDVSSYSGDVVIGVIMSGTSANLPAVSELTVVVE